MRKKTLTKKILERSKALAPASTVSLLSYVAISFCIAYVCCVILTVYYATLQTEMVATIQDTESGITELERTYYDGVSAVSSTNPLGQGYVRPHDVHYEQEKKSSGLSLVGR